MNTHQLYNIVFLGTPEFALPSLNALAQNENFKIIKVITQADKPVGRKKILTPSPVKVLAQKLNLPLGYELTELKQLQPDLGIVVAYGKIIPKEILALPKYGFINLHPSLLPKYRGPSPIQTALLNGDKTTGISIMQLDAGMDTGPLLLQEEIKNIINDNYITLSHKLSLLGADLLLKVLIPYLSGELTPKPQNIAKLPPTKIITREDGLVDLHAPAAELYNKFRAYTPWPGIYTIFKGQRLKILKAELINNCFKIQEVQLAGKNPLTLEEFERGYGKII